MKNKSIDLVNEKTERKELLEWIPMLVKKKIKFSNHCSTSYHTLYIRI